MPTLKKGRQFTLDSEISEPVCSKLTVEGMDADKFAWSEFEQLRWSAG